MQTLAGIWQSAGQGYFRKPPEILIRAFSLYTTRAAGNERAMRYTLPPSHPGQVIGLLGGSFDPPHAGHLHISREALKRFGLDRLWWLVSPGNPLKEQGPAPLGRRMGAARALVDHPRIDITDFEAQADTRYTAQTLRALIRARPGVRFVWLMGADNLAQFHLWQDWREIMNTVPVGVLARPGQRISARMSPAARVFDHARLGARQCHRLGQMDAPAWCFVNVPMMAISSTHLRQSGAWADATQK